MLCSVWVGSRQAVPNKLIWFSDAVLFVVDWRQNVLLLINQNYDKIRETNKASIER